MHQNEYKHAYVWSSMKVFHQKHVTIDLQKISVDMQVDPIVCSLQDGTWPMVC